MKLHRSCLLALLCASRVAGAALPAAAPAPPPLTVVTSFYPMYVATLNVVGGAAGVRVVNLAPVTAGCAEGYALTPADLKLLVTADVLVVNGAGLEEYVGKAAAQCPRLHVVDASAGLTLLKADGEPNAHLWVSPTMAALQARAIAAQLAALDPASARREIYAKNAEAYAQRLETLAGQMRAGLMGAPSRRVIAFHDGLPYLARDLDLEVLAVVEPAPGQAPSAGQLANVVKLVRSAPGPVAFLTEKNVPSPAAEALSRELGVPCYPFDLGTNGPLEPAAARDVAIQTAEANLATLRAALGVPGVKK